MEVRNVLVSLARQCCEYRIRYFLIGGWALNAYGVARQTLDDDIKVPVPGLLHMVAMKLHALKHNKERRLGRDLPDIIELVRMNELDVDGDEFRALCLQFGTSDLYEQILQGVRS